MGDKEDLKKDSERRIFLEKSPIKVARVDPHLVGPLKTLDELERKLKKLLHKGF